MRKYILQILQLDVYLLINYNLFAFKSTAFISNTFYINTSTIMHSPNGTGYRDRKGTRVGKNIKFEF